MKTCLLIITCILSFAFLRNDQQGAKTFFYYCISKPSNLTGSETQKQTVLYSGIHQTEAEESSFKIKVKEWQSFADTRCTSKTGCTGDLNYYPTREEAKAAYNKMLQTFSDTSKFLLKKVKFQ